MDRKEKNSKLKNKRKRKKGRVHLIFILLLFVCLVAIGLVWLYSPSASPSGKSPFKVGANASIASPSVDNSGIDAVDDTGGAGWAKIKSKGGSSSTSIENISTTNYIIYRVHNPKTLKTATTLMPKQEYLSQLALKYPKALIMNTSGFNLTTGRLMGFQINNGQLLEGWNVQNFGTSAFVVYKNGSTGIVTDETPAAQVVANGAVQSYSFGAVLVKNGKLQPNDGSINWEYHSFIGADKNNNLILMISRYWNYNTFKVLYQKLNLESMLTLDGGNSSQMYNQGVDVFTSSAKRALPDYIVVE